MQQEAQGLASSKASELKLSRGKGWCKWYSSLPKWCALKHRDGSALPGNYSIWFNNKLFSQSHNHTSCEKTHALTFCVVCFIYLRYTLPDAQF